MQALFSCFHSRLGGFTPHRMPSTASNLVARWALLAFCLSRSHTSTGQCCTPAPPGLSHDHGQLSGFYDCADRHLVAKMDWMHWMDKRQGLSCSPHPLGTAAHQHPLVSAMTVASCLRFFGIGWTVPQAVLCKDE